MGQGCPCRKKRDSNSNYGDKQVCNINVNIEKPTKIEGKKSKERIIKQNNNKDILISPNNALPTLQDINNHDSERTLTYENNISEIQEQKREIEFSKKELEKEIKNFENQKKKYEEKKKIELEKIKLEKEKNKIEAKKREMEQEKLFDEQRNQIEKDKKILNDMIREREEEKRKEEEKKRLKEMSIKLAEEKAKIEEEKIKEKKLRFKEEEDKKNREAQDFYDMILDFNSFEQLKSDGWNAYFTKLGKKKYDKCLNEKNIVIGVVGNKNRGKSYLLGRIMKMKEYENPNGFLITTKGISCIFPKLDNTDKTFITLDTAGKDNPLLQNTFFKEDDKNELIRNIARDQKVTEIALNDFIIQESDVLITVLEQLSFNEQEMLKNLINQINIYGINYAKENKCRSKRLIVIHNLMNISTIEGIKKFIDEVLLKSLTFSLDIQVNKKQNITIYIQNMHQDKKQIIEIIHLIVGDDNNEDIKREYNEPAFEFIRKNITVRVGRKFNILESFKNFIIENSKNYFEGEVLKKDSIKINNEIPENDKIIIPITLSQELKDKKLIFKKFYINAKGIHNFSSALEPRYSTDLIEINNNYYIEIEFELSGDIELKDNDIICVTDKEQYVFTIKGKTIQNNEDMGNGPKDFEFQPIINRFLPIKNEGKVASKKEYEIIVLKEKAIINKDEEYGIYNIKIPVKINEKIIDFDESEDNENL